MGVRSQKGDYRLSVVRTVVHRPESRGRAATSTGGVLPSPLSPNIRSLTPSGRFASGGGKAKGGGGERLRERGWEISEREGRTEGAGREQRGAISGAPPLG